MSGLGKTTLIVPASKVPLIIGKKGATIRSLEEKYNVSITIPKGSNEVSISGSDINRKHTHEDIENIIGVRVSNHAPKIRKIKLDGQLASMIVGKGGSTIKNIIHETKVLIDIKREEGSDESLVIIEGLEECIEAAIKIIEHIIGLKIGGGNETQDIMTTSQELGPINLTEKKISEVLFFMGKQPNTDNFKRFLRFIHSATITLDICVFTITDDDISREVIDRFRSGVSVRLITDDNQSKTLGSDIEKLHKSGIPIRLDNTGAHMHHKFAIIDDICVINGSLNWTRQARTLNSENTVISNDMDLVQPFITHFNMLWDAFENTKYTITN